MKQKIFLTFLSLCMSSILLAQDTTWVQTLTFDSITGRRGVFQFPEDQNCRKVLMYYTLKCDQATTQDEFACGEWDYLTYTNVYKPTGLLDSTEYQQPSFTYLSGAPVNSIAYKNNPTYNYYRDAHKYTTFEDTLSFNNYEIGEGGSSTNKVLNAIDTDGRSQFLWRKSELEDAGLDQGLITGIKLFVEETGSDLRHFTIMMKNVNTNEITSENLIDEMQEVYSNTIEMETSDWYDFNFHQAFEWDGSSNIAIELAFSNFENGQSTHLKADETSWNSGVSTSSSNYVLNLDGNSDYIDLPDHQFVSGDFTIEAWIYKRNNNNWSRFFDLGNGAGQDNVLVAFSKGTSGKLYYQVKAGNQSASLETDDYLPLNEWSHLAVTMKDSTGFVYVNGEFITSRFLKKPENIVRESSFIGKSNWSNNGYADVLMDEFRILSSTKSQEEVQMEMYNSVENPEQEDNLVLYYDFNEGTGDVFFDKSANQLNGTGWGQPDRLKIRGKDLFLDLAQDNLRPCIRFERLESNNPIQHQEFVLDSLLSSPTHLVVYNQDDEITVADDTISVWVAGYRPVYEGCELVDSVNVGYDDQLIKEDYVYYGEPFEIKDRFEIARFITPYGIGMDLGEQGFTWVYDVTDFAQLLKGDVDLSAGNQQELIDLKFALIEGTPPRDVVKLDTIWGTPRSYLYKDLSDDSLLTDRSLTLEDEAERFKVITRITGHGHNSSNGSYPHCCEWKDNTHYLKVNGSTFASWHIWLPESCGINPLYPQGGNWAMAREGWCPGDKVKDHEFDITDQVTSNSVSLDYHISEVPSNNQGMGYGNYVMAMYLAQYGPANYSLDAEVYEVISPSNQDYYSRKNPICSEPQIIIRNNGDQNLTSLRVTYGVSGGEEHYYDWTGDLEPMEKASVYLPAFGADFWIGDTDHIFTATVSNPNGGDDMYPDNDSYTTSFEMPDIYDKVVFKGKLPNNQNEYDIYLKDEQGDIVLKYEGMPHNQEFYIRPELEYGCYVLEVIDQMHMGLDYMYIGFPGYLKIVDDNDQVIKVFEPEFGKELKYSFRIGDVTYIEEPNLDLMFDLYPNPSDSKIILESEKFEGDIRIEIFGVNGNMIYRSDEYSENHFEKRIDVSNWTPGFYIAVVKSNDGIFKRKFIVE